MNIFDIIGPVMVGPSSSHTAGAVKIGYIARQLMNNKIRKAELYLHGSFSATGKGHGTDKALVAGLLGMKPDDNRIPVSFEIAEELGLEIRFGSINMRDVHPNSVFMRLYNDDNKKMEIDEATISIFLLYNDDNKKMEIVASSIGGGQIRICKIDGLDVNFSGDQPTLIVHNTDQPGHVSKVTTMLAEHDVNISSMQLYRTQRGGNAVMVIECDQEVPKTSLDYLKNMDGIVNVTYLSKEEK